ncbi:MAG TPA: 1,2-phenylacetyl-CoA epoxidase subunit PaaC [Acetobacteraceae bacterium]|nr:1,2-phenylacetyl-CoA epoxidase subunit PaaC [Acetobacteraceae bacterium]
MATTSITVANAPLLDFVLRRADDALILGHRLSEWCGHAPTLEEDLALANVGLDLLGVARALYAYAGEIEGAGHDEDAFAYLRDAGQFRNLLLVEQPNGDFAHTVVRQFLYSAYADPFWRAMTRSADPMLAAVAAKSEKESAYHLRHASEWLIRLGDGTEESHRRAQAALDALLPYAGELSFVDDAERGLIAAGIAADPASLHPAWHATLDAVLAAATLARPAGEWSRSGGRTGRHSEHLGPLLAMMQVLPRTHPGARW